MHQHDITVSLVVPVTAPGHFHAQSWLPINQIVVWLARPSLLT
jgi:hypothetical protein